MAPDPPPLHSPFPARRTPPAGTLVRCVCCPTTNTRAVGTWQLLRDAAGLWVLDGGGRFGVTPPRRRERRALCTLLCPGPGARPRQVLAAHMAAPEAGIAICILHVGTSGWERLLCRCRSVSGCGALSRPRPWRRPVPFGSPGRLVRGGRNGNPLLRAGRISPWQFRHSCIPYFPPRADQIFNCSIPPKRKCMVNREGG